MGKSIPRIVPPPPPVLPSPCQRNFTTLKQSNQTQLRCFCGTLDVSTLTESDQCTTLCQGNPSETCGGYLAIEVFRMGEVAKPFDNPSPSPPPAPEGSTYMGCYTDKGGAGRVMVAGPVDNAMSTKVGILIP